MTKIIKLTALIIIMTIMTACQGEADIPPEVNYGNSDITETNVITIGELKRQYSSTIFAAANTFKQINSEIQIKGRVLGNDIQSNIYSEVAVGDETGAIMVCVSQSALYTYLPVGQQLLISLKDLYIGGYNKQPEIGTPYTNKNGVTYVSRMYSHLWEQHFKLIGGADASAVTPEVFDMTRITDTDYMNTHCGQLMTIKNVAFADADGNAAYAPEELKDNANCVNRRLKDLSSSQIVIRTSTYADFAADTLPTEKVNITGIFTRYGSLWQVLIRTSDDVVISN